MVICKPPIIEKRYSFLFKHLDCDCVADTTEEEKPGKIKIIAYAENVNENDNLYNTFLKNNYSNKYKYLKAITRDEVGCVE